MSRRSATRWKQRTIERTHKNKQIARISPFSWIFSQIFPKGTNFCFLFFTNFFILFSEQGSQKMQPQKLAPTTEVGCGLQKFSTCSEKRAKTLTIFFLYFPEFFWQFWRNQTGRSRVWVGSKWCQEAAEKISDFSDKRAKSYACFTEGISRYVFREAHTAAAVRAKRP